MRNILRRAKRASQLPEQRRASFGSPAFLAPLTVVLCLVFVLPLLSMISASFRSMTGPAQVGSDFTISHYTAFFGDFFYLKVLIDTFALGLSVVVVCLMVAYPISYFLARTQSKWRGVLLFFIVSPLLVSAVVRNVGWFPLLSSSGMINWLLLKSGLITTPVALINNTAGVVIGLSHALLPFMILTLTTAIQKVEPVLEEAAASLGARPIAAFRHVMLPLTLPGLIAGSLLVFTMAIAAFTTPAILSGNHVLLMSTFITQQFLSVLNYPVGATAATILMVVVGLFTMLALKITRRLEISK